MTLRAGRVNGRPPRANDSEPASHIIGRGSPPVTGRALNWYGGAMGLNGKHVVVIGAGISGLTAAYRAQQAGARVTLVESSAHTGGVLHTERRDGFLLELGPDCWVSNKPGAMALARELGLEADIIGTAGGNEKLRQSFILHEGKLTPIPQGFFLLAPTSIEALRGASVLSWAGKLRVARELFIKARTDGADESLASFMERRFGREALDRIAQPMVAGIYTADPAKLSLKATFPQFMDMEREFGSVLRGMRKRAKEMHAHKAAGPRYGLFVTLKGGVQALPDALSNKLSSTAVGATYMSPLLSTRATKIERDGAKWRVEIEPVEAPRSAGALHSGTLGNAAMALSADAVIIALPTHAAARLLNGVKPELARELAGVSYANSAVVNLAFERSQIAHDLNGMGFVVPHVEKREIVACSFSSVKFEGRAPAGKVLLRAFMGGALLPQQSEYSESQLIETALRELSQILGIKGAPLFAVASRHRASMAQYEVGHLERLARIEALAAPLSGLRLIGNGYHGIGIPDCIARANDAIAALERA
jgi:oxygen-dependent protoporphyrinogen oxidase